MIDIYVFKTHGSMLKVKVTLRGQRSKLYSLYRVWVITSQIMVVSSLYYVEMFTLICKHHTRQVYIQNPCSYVKGQGHAQRSKVKIVHFIPFPGHNFASYSCISMIFKRYVNSDMQTCRMENPGYIQKVKVTFKGSKVKICVFCTLTRA